MYPARVLVVEDEIIVATDLAGHLGDLGYEVVGIAADGKRALDLVATERPALVLMDIRIRGELDGIEVAEKIRCEYRTPVVFLTASADDTTVERATETQPYGYLIKPYRFEELRATLRIGLQRHQLEREEAQALEDILAILGRTSRGRDFAASATPRRREAVEAYRLSSREAEVLLHLTRGASVSDISERLFISPHTVRNHLKALFQKCGVHSQVELVTKILDAH